MVCTRTPNPSRPGARHSTVWQVPAAMNAVLALAGRLVADGIEMVTLESTADYGRIWYYVLEGAGLAVQLVTASQARNLPGRPKTDRLDAMWLARLTEWGMLRPSFVPPAPVRCCGTTPGRAPTWSRTGPAAGSGWKSCWKAR